MVVVGVIGVEHPLGVRPPQHGEVGVRVDDRRRQHLAVERERRGDIPDEEVQRETVERAAVVGGRHPGVARPELHARIRSPFGSQRGSAATRPSTHSPKNSTSTRVPGVAASTGRYA